MEDHMSRFTTTMLALGVSFPLLLAGCGGGTAEKTADAVNTQDAEPRQPLTPEQRLEGQWQGQIVLDEDAQRNLPPAQVAKLQSMTMGMEFLPDGKLVLAGLKDDGKPYQSYGAWRIVKVEDDNITIKSIEASGKETDAVLMFESDDSFLMPLKTEVANLGAMRFERLR